MIHGMHMRQYILLLLVLSVAACVAVFSALVIALNSIGTANGHIRQLAENADHEQSAGYHVAEAIHSAVENAFVAAAVITLVCVWLGYRILHKRSSGTDCTARCDGAQSVTATDVHMESPS